jgi:hypothetical protein
MAKGAQSKVKGKEGVISETNIERPTELHRVDAVK